MSVSEDSSVVTVGGIAALLTSLWALVMITLGSYGPAPYTFAHRFAHDIDSPVLALELAHDRSDVDAVLQQESENAADRHAAIRALRLNTVLDLGFIPLYTVYLLALARLAGGRGRPIAALFVGAAVFDYIENLFIFRTLAGGGPLPFVPSLIKWGLLAIGLAVIGAGFLRGGTTLYAYPTRALLGLAHLIAAALIALAVVLGERLGYSWLELGIGIFSATVLVNTVGLLGPWVGRWFPGRDIRYVEDFCRKRERGMTASAVRADLLTGTRESPRA